MPRVSLSGSLVVRPASLSVVPCDSPGRWSLSLGLPLLMALLPSLLPHTPSTPPPLPATLHPERWEAAPSNVSSVAPVPAAPCSPCPSVFFRRSVFPSSPGALAWTGPVLLAKPPSLHGLRGPEPLSPHHRPWPSRGDAERVGGAPAAALPARQRLRSFAVALSPLLEVFAQNFILKSVFLILHTSPKLLQPFPRLSPAVQSVPGAVLLTQPEGGAGWEGLRGCWIFHSINW